MKNNATILTLICFGIIVLSLFLPFYEGPRQEITFREDSLVVVDIYEYPEFQTKMVVFNGLGSVFALVNLLLGSLLLLVHFFFPRSFAGVIFIAVAFAVSLFSLIYATSEGQGTPFPDSMLLGFYLLLVSQVVLIAQAFTRVITAPPKGKGNPHDLLDF